MDCSIFQLLPKRGRRLFFSAFLLALHLPLSSTAEPFRCHYLFGRLTTIGSGDSYGIFSALIGTKQVFAQNGSLQIFDLATKTTKSLPIPAEAMVVVSPYGNQAALTLRQGEKVTLGLVDLEKGKLTRIAEVENAKFPRKVDPASVMLRNFPRPTAFDSSADAFVYYSGLRDIHLVPANGSKPLEWQMPGEILSVDLAGNGKALVQMKKGSLILDLKSGKTIPVDGLQLPEGSHLTHTEGNTFFLLAGTENPELIALDALTGSQRKMKVPGLDGNNVHFLPGTLLYGKKTGEYQNSLELLDLKSGKTAPLGGKVMSFSFDRVQSSKDGKVIAWMEEATQRGEPNLIKIYNRETGQTKILDLGERSISLQSGISSDGKLFSATVMEGNDRTSWVKVWKIDSGEVSSFPIQDVIAIRSLTFANQDQSLLLQGSRDSSKLLDLQDWDSFVKAAGRIPATTADTATLARSGKLRLARDFPQMLAFFRSGKFKADPETSALYLMQILEESPNTYLGVLADFPELLPLLKNKPLDTAKLSPALRKRWTKVTEEHLQHRLGLLHATEPKADLKFWESLIPLRPFLKSLPEEIRTEAIVKISTSLSSKAAEGGEALRGIFPPKLFKFAKQEVRSWLGEPPKQFTDFVLVREENTLRPVIIGTQPIDGAEESATLFGIYAKALDPVEIPTSGEAGQLALDKTMKWKQGGKEFTAKAQVRTGIPVGDLISKEAQPDYSALWKDKKLTGLVVTGENMQNSVDDILPEYLDYYKSKGFKFEKPKPVDDMPAFMAQEIRAGRLDYMIKEAHTDGMENDLFRLFAKGTLQRGVRKARDGSEEVVYVFHPDPKAKTTLISNKDFGTWVREREKNDSGPLVYFNTSCWGADKACHEYEAAATSKLLVLATTKSADTFLNVEDSALQQLLTGFREKKSYAEMREMMKKDPSYAKGTDNVYLLPDDEAFTEQIRNKLQRTVETNISVTGPDGKPYHLDTAD